MKTRLAALALCLAASLTGCGPKNDSEPINEESMAIDGLEDDTEATQSAMDASELAIGGPALAFGGGDGSCTGTVTGTAEIAVCSRSVPSTRTVTWSCTGPNGNGVSGTATVTTTVLDDSDCPNVTVRHDVAFSRHRQAGTLSADLAGTAQVTLVLDSANRTAQRTVALDVTRQVENAGNLIRDQHLTGERVADLAANGAGPADDTRTVNGNTQIEFLLRGSELDVGATNLFWNRGCCHPVGGRIDWVLSGTDEGSGSLRFGPACGEALRADDSAVTLPACPTFN